MVQIYVTYSSFHNWRSSAPLGKRLFNKSMPLYFLLYASSILVKPKVSVKPKLRRNIVVLKSPFHYKGPKHHIQYKFFTITVSASVKPEFSDATFRILTSYFHQNKPHRAIIRRPRKLKLPTI